MKVSSGKIKQPYCILGYGIDGVGKTSFAAHAPDPIFIEPEKGSSHLDVSRFNDINSYADVLTSIDQLTKETHDYKTLVIDTLDWLEQQIFDHICTENNKKSIELCEGGYGKGYVRALKECRMLMIKLNTLRQEKQMNIIMLAHSTIVKHEDPTTPEGYDRYQLKLHKSKSIDIAALWREYVDAVLFMTYKVFISSKDGQKARGVGEGIRVMYSEQRPGWDAKNRLGLPFELDISWKAFDAAAKIGQPETLKAVSQEIDALLTVSPKNIIEKATIAIRESKNDYDKLVVIRNRLRMLTSN